MGTVFHARDTSLPRDVAIKQMLTGPHVDPQIRERFLREARVCASLQHPNIVTVFDLTEAEGVAYIVMEYLAGNDWSGVIRNKTQLEMQERLTYMSQICDALDYAHRKGIVHRDIKPSNLFLTVEGRPKLLDFGIAKLPESKLTIAGKVPGTPDYMAPEQLLGQTCDGRSDIFSVALVFSELLTGVHPFRGTFIPQRIVKSPPESLCASAPQISTSLESAIFLALEKDPGKRYQTASQFGDALRSIQGETSPSRQSPTVALSSGPSSAPGGATTLLPRAPTGADPDEWRLSEFMRLLDDFDRAIEESSSEQAKSVVSRMKKLGAVDQRFEVAVVDCEGRYEALEARSRRANGERSDPPVTPRETPVVPLEQKEIPARVSTTPQSTPLSIPLQASVAPIKPDQPGAGVVGAGSVGLGQTNSDWINLLQSPAVRTSSPLMASPLSSEEPHRSVAFPTPSILPVKRQAQAINKRIVLVALLSAGALIFLVLVVRVLLFSGTEVLPHAASASAISAVVRVLGGPGEFEKEIVTIHRGERVNVLRLPQKRDQRWIAVQFVTPKTAYSAGYVLLGDLSGWQSDNVEAELQMLLMFAPLPDSSVNDAQTFIDSLRAFATRHLGAPESAEAEAEARRREALIRDRK
jgi:serine/threonine protein kinase